MQSVRASDSGKDAKRKMPVLQHKQKHSCHKTVALKERPPLQKVAGEHTQSIRGFMKKQTPVKCADCGKFLRFDDELAVFVECSHEMP